MWTLNEVKTRGREAFKNHYWPSVGAGFLLLIASGGAVATMGHSTYTYQADLPQSFYDMPQNEQTYIVAAVAGLLCIVALGAMLLKALVFNPLQVGCADYFNKNIDDPTTEGGTVLSGFSDYKHSVCTMLLKDVFIGLWSLLFVIPGVVKSYSYAMVPYLIKDHPELSATEAITRSREMMQGNKGRAFLMDLSFIGWYLVGTLTLGLGNIFWTTPYHASSTAALYHELSQN